MKKMLGIIMVMVLLFSNISFAEESEEFVDLSGSHWAYKAVMTMTENGILNGYDDGTFRPDEPITRGEFATIMVLSLGLEPNFDAESTFVDLGNDHWVLPYVDVAKNYLTGYHSSAGVKFKPNEAALREDMAVALVRAKGFDISDANVSYLEAYADDDSISDYLKKYVGTAVKNKIMIGSVSDGNKYFNPLGELTRAEAAVLLLNVIDFEEEKIVLSDEEINDDVNLTVYKSGNELELNWTVGIESGLKGFKIVASKENASPVYPEDGYVKYISNTGVRAFDLSGKLANNGGDTDYLLPGESYYFSITALYESGKVPSNSVYVEYPGSNVNTVVNLFGVEKENSVVLEWDVEGSEYVSGYKVVASKSDGTPIYPENGYYKYIVAGQDKRVEINVGDYYNNGDFEKFTAGEDYFFSITALKGDEKIASNTLQFGFGELAILEEPIVKLYGSEEGNNIVLEWTDENDQNITGFKVVASKGDSSPMYPENGYFKYVKKSEEQRAVINVGDWYNSGDIDKFTSGNDYYFSITALYGDKKVSSNVLHLGFEEEVVQTPPQVTLSGVVDGNFIKLEWTSFNDHNVDGFKVVASKSDSSPQYPDNGYFRYITIGQDEHVVIGLGDYYKNGDFEKFADGESYFFTITTLYDGKKVNSNTIELEF